MSCISWSPVPCCQMSLPKYLAPHHQHGCSGDQELCCWIRHVGRALWEVPRQDVWNEVPTACSCYGALTGPAAPFPLSLLCAVHISSGTAGLFPSTIFPLPGTLPAPKCPLLPSRHCLPRFKGTLWRAWRLLTTVAVLTHKHFGYVSPKRALEISVVL